MEKKQLRRKMLSLRQQIFRQEAGAHCLQLLHQVPEFQSAPVLFCYAAYGAELPAWEIAAAAKQMGKQLAFPRVMPDGRMKFFSGELHPGFRGILEPAAEKEILPCTGDFMLLPGLAFSLEGDRLGYGGGYYDRYLAEQAQRPFCCGLGFREQLLDRLPREPFDQRLDLLVTPEKIIRF